VLISNVLFFLLFIVSCTNTSARRWLTVLQDGGRIFKAYVVPSRVKIIKNKKYSLHNMPRSHRGGLQVQLDSLPSKLYEGKWLTPRPDRFSPRKEPQYPMYSTLGGSQGRSGRAWEKAPFPYRDSNS